MALPYGECREAEPRPDAVELASATGAAGRAARDGRLAGCSASSGVRSAVRRQTVNLVAYSVPKPAYDALSRRSGKTADGKGVKFEVLLRRQRRPRARRSSAGQKADYVALLARARHDQARAARSVDADWNTGANQGHGLATRSSSSRCARATRKHITGWDDLIKPGVKIVTPDPASSGSAKWNILAAYTHVLADGGTEADAEAYLTKFFKNVVSQPASGATRPPPFLGGTGDVLISYENEAIAARQAGKTLDYIVPETSRS